MSVESATYLSDLNTAWPTGGDFRSEGDNHFRLLKTVLKNTFPNLGGKFNRVLARGTTFTPTTTDNFAVYNCTGTITANFPTAATVGDGTCWVFMNRGAGIVTLDPSGSELINGASTYVLQASQGAIVYCDGSAFYAFGMLNNVSPFMLTVLDDVDANTARATLCAAPLDSPAFTGTPTAPTASAGTATTQIATTAFVANTVGVGQVAFFARNTPPGGWLKADGSAVSRTTYAGLFAAIGTTWGAGDGSTTFNLPDLRGEFPRGWDDGRGVDAGRAFASAQAGAIEAHTHVTPGMTFTAVNVDGADVASFRWRYSDTEKTTQSTGGAETRPRNIALLACIKI